MTRKELVEKLSMFILDHEQLGDYAENIAIHHSKATLDDIDEDNVKGQLYWSMVTAVKIDILCSVIVDMTNLDIE